MNEIKCLENMVMAAKKAGLEVMKGYGTVTDIGKEISAEDSISIVANEKAALSELDEKAQIISMEELLTKGYNSCGILGEEENGQIKLLRQEFSHYGKLVEGEYTFVIDPIDGTRNLLNTNPANHGKGGDLKNKDYFAICINLAHGKDIIGGVFHFPALGKTIKTLKGKGTYINDKRIVLPKIKKASFDDPFRVGSTVKELRQYFTNLVNFNSSCGNLLSFLDETLDEHSYGYMFREVDILDFGCTAIAYQEAGGFAYDSDLNKRNIGDILITRNNGHIYLNGFTILGPTKEYCVDMLKLIREKMPGYK